MIKDFTPMISIVIPVYNGGEFIEDALQSALNQTYKNIEIIVVDDGSTDNTEKIIKKFQNRIKYFKKENGGVSSALNLAIKEARGEYISWLSHDDLYIKDKLKLQVEELAKLEDKNTIIYSNFNYVDENLKILADGKSYQEFDEKLMNVSLYPLLKGFINGCTLLIKKSIYEEFGYFDTSLAGTQDYKLFFEMLKKYPVKYVDKKLIYSRVHKNQCSNTFGIDFYNERTELWNYIIDDINEGDVRKFNLSKEAFWFEFYKVLKLNNLKESYAKALLKIADNSKPSILLTTSMKKGGLGRYINDLRKILKDDYNIFVLYSDSYGIEISLNGLNLFEAELFEPVKYKDYYTNNDILNIVVKFALIFDIQFVIANGYINFGFNLFDKLNAVGMPVVWVVHDFSLCCLSQHLLSNEHKFCSFNKDENICLKCGENNLYAKITGACLGKNIIEARKYIEKTFLNKLDKIIFVSKSCKDTVKEYYKNLDENKTAVIYHGINDEKFFEINRRPQREKIKVGILGSIAPHKGEAAIRKIINSLPSERFEFYAFGSIPDDINARLILKDYTFEDNISLLLYQNEIDIVLLLSPSPETFSYTLSEAFVAQIPVIASDIGAYKERIEENGCGFLIDKDNTADEAVKMLLKIADNPLILKEKQENFNNYKEKNHSKMKSDYLNLLKTIEPKGFSSINFGMKQIFLEELIKRFEYKKIVKYKKFKYAGNALWRFLYRTLLRPILKIIFGRKKVKNKYDKKFL